MRKRERLELNADGVIYGVGDRCSRGGQSGFSHTFRAERSFGMGFFDENRNERRDINRTGNLIVYQVRVEDLTPLQMHLFHKGGSQPLGERTNDLSNASFWIHCLSHVMGRGHLEDTDLSGFFIYLNLGALRCKHPEHTGLFTLACPVIQERPIHWGVATTT